MEIRSWDLGFSHSPPGREEASGCTQRSIAGGLSPKAAGAKVVSCSLLVVKARLGLGFGVKHYKA